MSGARLSEARGEMSREDSDVQDVAGVDKGARSRRRKLCKARDSLLRGDEGTVDIDGRVATEVGKGERERVISRGEVSGADYDASVGQRFTIGDNGLPL